ncbi:MAG: electron transfer flavoprotein subunit beta/FixA family protein [Pseudomonadales bacterium]|nr:electron transfer flavoprotein subunit beta/FixA family protein [Pseudomonadales bacterium]NRA17137.1 electron transfer flavoprotein subunit beta/FixA family protein [Oceanospirillaceae bacterium]
MKILVAVKRVVDANIKVRVLSDETGIDMNDTKMALNPFCEIAVEEAIRLKESGSASEVIVVSIGPEKSQEQLRTALALGADRAILLQTDQVIEPLSVAKLLAKLVQEEQPELVILGKQSIDSDNNQTAQMLAALTGRPQGTFISQLSVDNSAIHITREVDNGLQKLSLQLPAVVSVDLRLNEPRFASLPSIMKAKRKPIDRRSAESFGIDLSPRIKHLKITTPAERKSGQLVASVAELVGKLKLEAEVI